MIKTFEANGKTVEEAIDKALLLANTTIENVEIEVLELGGKGVFGFGKKDARVRITQEIEEEPAEEIIPLKAHTPATAGNSRLSKAQPEEKGTETAPEDEAPVVKEMIRTRSGGPEETNKRSRGKEQKEARGSRHKEANKEANKEEQMPEKASKGPRAERAPKEPSEPKEQKSKEQNRAKDKPREKDSRPQREKSADHSERGERGERERGHRISEGEEATALAAEAAIFLKPIFNSLKVEPEREICVKEGILWLIFAGQGLGSLIGRRGETLNALQYLTNLAVNRDKKEHVRLVLDVEGYRAGREETLVALAKKMADKAVRSGRRVELEPMNPHERRVVHIALQNDKRVDTISQGEEPYRRVVINRRRNDGGHKRRSGKGENPAPAGAAEKMSLSQQLGQQFSQQMEHR